MSESGEVVEICSPTFMGSLTNAQCLREREERE